MTMTQDDRAIARKINLLKKHAAELSKMIPSDDGIADAVGLTREVEVVLAEVRHQWEATAKAEMEPIRDHDRSKRVSPYDKGAPVAVGKRYELVPQTKIVRSFNSPAILTAIAGDGLTILDALIIAREVDAVRLGWRWTQLKGLLYEREVPLRIAPREVDDDLGTDGAMVGERKVDAGMKRVLIGGGK